MLKIQAAFQRYKQQCMEVFIDQHRSTEPNNLKAAITRNDSSHLLLIRACCVGFVRSRTSKDFLYIIEVEWTDESRYCVKRTYRDFLIFQQELTKAFEESVAPLPGARWLQRNTEQLAEEREQLLNSWLSTLLSLTSTISQSHHVWDFLMQRKSDPIPVAKEDSLDRYSSGGESECPELESDSECWFDDGFDTFDFQNLSNGFDFSQPTPEFESVALRSEECDAPKLVPKVRTDEETGEPVASESSAAPDLRISSEPEEADISCLMSKLKQHNDNSHLQYKQTWMD